jgi:Rap1a immunity proteins
MRTAIRSLLLTLLLSLPATEADADSVKFLLPHCKALVSSGQTDMKGAYLAGQCLGMIKASAFIVQAAAPGGLPFRACLPDNTVTTDQLVTVVLQWMERKPDLAGEDFIVVTMLALAATWPCK